MSPFGGLSRLSTGEVGSNRYRGKNLPKSPWKVSLQIRDRASSPLVEKQAVDCQSTSTSKSRV
jgi:hypothetical protein